MPFFSVIISLYNKENYIENTIKSVLNQTFDDYEIIVINDGSTDKSGEIVKNINSPKIKYYSQQNSGASKARNVGIKVASAAYIAFLDADDLWFPNHLDTLHQIIFTFPRAGIYASRYISEVAPETFLKNKFLHLPENFEGIVPDFFYSSLVNRIALTSAVAIPKMVFDEIGCFNILISSGQDLDLWIRIAIKMPVVISNKVTMKYNALDVQSLSKTNIEHKKLIDFSQFEKEEKNDKNLKAFLDVNRMDYALKFKISGNLKTSKEYYNTIAKENITMKNCIIYHLPRWMQIPLLRFKKLLLKKGIDFSVYR